MGTVTIHRVRFLEDSIYEGSIPSECYDNAETEIHDDISAADAARLIRREGLTFEATGGEWAANPDGSYISDYATAERTEVSAHLSEFPDRVANAIRDHVDSK